MAWTPTWSAFASPYSRSEYGLTTVQTGNIFSMHQLGMLLGGFLFACLGDILGRRPTVILAAAAFGVPDQRHPAGRHAAAGLGAEHRIRA
jgi:MFS family permease